MNSLSSRNCQVLTSSFKGDIRRSKLHRSFPDEYFTCQAQCSSCNSRCEAKVDHSLLEQHRSSVECVFKKQHENKRLFCTT